MSPRAQYLVLIVAAFVLSMVPVVHWPFSWLETYFHEISHGVAAIVSGGSVERIVLHFSGSGVCYTRGGWRPLVSFSGYFGAVLWGAVIYLGARATGRGSHWLAVGVAVLVAASGILWARDVITIAIMLVICGVMYLSFRYVMGNVFPRLMEFAGIYVMVSAARAPLHLIDGRHVGDGAMLANLSYVPEIVWALIWCGLAVGALVLIWTLHGVPARQLPR